MGEENRTESKELVNITEPEKHDNNTIQRDSQGKFKPGISANPGGRPKGSVNLTTILKKKLKECPEGEEKTYGELFIDRLIELAIIEKNINAYKLIMNYIDGLPKGDLGGEYLQNVFVNIIKPNGRPNNQFQTDTETVPSLAEADRQDDA